MARHNTSTARAQVADNLDDLLAQAHHDFAARVAQAVLEGELTASGWLRLAITGTAYAKAGAPTEAMLDESRQFIARLATEHAIADAGATLIPVVLARMIVEFYGGNVEASTGAKQDPGFVILLPVAA